MGFNKEFIWGAATAAYQIEGAAYEDGKGLSIWDVFCKTKDKVYNGDSGDTACDTYHRWPEDIELLKGLGVDAYRFSLSWPRIIPDGDGEINEKGLAFYDGFIDGLMEAGITPYVTMFHWDLPYELHKKGSWMNRDSALWFERYADIITKRYGDRVKHWITLNEPQVFIGMGHESGQHAPGHKLGEIDLITKVHNVLRAHGKAVQVVRKNVPGAEVGFAPTTVPLMPKTDDPKLIDMCRKLSFDDVIMPGMENGNGWGLAFNQALWSDPVFFGKYPSWVKEKFGWILPESIDEDLKEIQQPVDFYGVNIYQGLYLELDENGEITQSKQKEGAPVTGYNWPVTPEALYWGPKFIYERYKKKIYITENGLSMKDWVALDGKVHDHGRMDFLNRYLMEYRRAAEEGVELAGYFQWSLMDNFEWADGYRERFGLVHVDMETGKRTPKESYYWYRDVVKSNGESL